MNEDQGISIDDIIEFIKNEQEIYGPFSASITKELNESLSEVIRDPQPGEESQKKDSSSEENIPNPEMSLNDQLQACKSIEELRSFCEKAEELKTDLEGTNLVFGVGNPRADLMLIGEAPGEQEDIQGEPFVGAAGQLLNKILAAINFTRDDIYIANILKHRPPGNRNPDPDERERSLPYLLRQIELIQPKIILCLGKVSGTTLLNRDEALKNLRGKFYPFHNTELTVTYHPAALLRNAKWKRPVWEDVQTVRKRYDELGCKP
ncbi:MAG: uracil-DNA glycosylase [Balneolaceae bacterium]